MFFHKRAPSCMMAVEMASSGNPGVLKQKPTCTRGGSDLEDVAGTLAAEVVLAGQDDHGFGEHLQAHRTHQLLLQVLHGGSSGGAGA